jgi:hypothetical protein
MFARDESYEGLPASQAPHAPTGRAALAPPTSRLLYQKIAVFPDRPLPRLHRLLLGFCPDLLVNLFSQELCDDLGKGGIVHVAREYLPVLVHAVDELAFQGLVEDVLEVFQRVDHGGLLDVRVGDGLLANLVEEELVGGFELGSESFVHDVDQPRQFDLLVMILAHADRRRRFHRATIPWGQRD